MTTLPDEAPRNEGGSTISLQAPKVNPRVSETFHGDTNSGELATAEECKADDMLRWQLTCEWPTVVLPGLLFSAVPSKCSAEINLYQPG